MYDCSVQHALLTYKFTGKERDSESGLDNFGRRYYASTYGRFLSADSIDNDFVTADPRSLNRYGYARNNPLKFIDPTGEAAELTGKTDEERRKQLEAIRAALRNDKAAALLFINEIKDKKGSRFFVGIQGNAKDFAKLGSLEARLGAIVESQQVVRFSLSSEVVRRDPDAPSFRIPGLEQTLFRQEFNVGAKFGGGVTLPPALTFSGQIEVTVDPNNIQDRSAIEQGIPPFDCRGSCCSRGVRTCIRSNSGPAIHGDKPHGRSSGK